MMDHPSLQSVKYPHRYVEIVKTEAFGNLISAHFSIQAASDSEDSPEIMSQQELFDERHANLQPHLDSFKAAKAALVSAGFFEADIQAALEFYLAIWEP